MPWRRKFGIRAQDELGAGQATQQPSERRQHWCCGNATGGGMVTSPDVTLTLPHVW